MPVHPHRTPCRFIRTARHAGSVHSLKSVRLLNLSHVETEIALPGTRRIREALAQASADMLGFYEIQPRSRPFDQPVARVWDATGQKSFCPARHFFTESCCVVAGHSF